MKSEDVRDLNGLSGAIGMLKHMHKLVENDLRGTNDHRYDDCKLAKHTIAEAEASYKRLADRLR